MSRKNSGPRAQGVNGLGQTSRYRVATTVFSVDAVAGFSALLGSVGSWCLELGTVFIKRTLAFGGKPPPGLITYQIVSELSFVFHSQV
jgi:hypothetical protein